VLGQRPWNGWFFVDPLSNERRPIESGCLLLGRTKQICSYLREEHLKAGVSEPCAIDWGMLLLRKSVVTPYSAPRESH